MSRRVIVSARARLDAIEQAEWIALTSLDQSDRFGFALSKTFESIMQAPEAGRVFEDPAREPGTVRWRMMSGFRSHLVFYDVTADEVLILPVLHAGRDLPAALLEG